MSVAATHLLGQSNAGAEVVLNIPSEATGAKMPADFVGLSYEVQQLVDPDFFSESNIGLIR